MHLQRAIFITHFHIRTFNNFYFLFYFSAKHTERITSLWLLMQHFHEKKANKFEGHCVTVSRDQHAPFIAISQDLIYTKWQRRLCWFWTEHPLLWKISTGIFFFHGWRSFPHLNIKVWQVFPTYYLYNLARYLLISSRVITIKSWKSFLVVATSFNMIPSFGNNHKGKKKAKGKFLSRALHFWEKGKCDWHYITLTWKTSPCQGRPNGRPGHVQHATRSSAWKPRDLGSVTKSPASLCDLKPPASLDLSFLQWVWRQDDRLRNSVPNSISTTQLKFSKKLFSKHTWKPGHSSFSLLTGK